MLILLDEIDYKAQATIISYIRKLKKNQVFKMMLNSNGGSVNVALGIHDIIKPLRDSVIIVAGSASSSAFTILQAAKLRLSFPNSYFLIHEVSSAAKDDTEKDKKESALIDPYLGKMMEKLGSARMGLDNYRKLFKQMIVDAETAYKLNVIDGIIEGSKTYGSF